MRARRCVADGLEYLRVTNQEVLDACFALLLCRDQLLELGENGFWNDGHRASCLQEYAPFFACLAPRQRPLHGERVAIGILTDLDPTIALKQSETGEVALWRKPRCHLKHTID